MTVAQPMAVREELLGPVRSVLDWMLRQRDREGAIRCPHHKIEHTGKSAGAIVIAAELAQHDPSADPDALFEVARQQAMRLVGRLEREDTSTCFTFRPGRHDPYNCSNSVIDGGACSDALATCVQVFGDRLSTEEREAMTHASVLHAQTYLRHCVIDKPIPAQKAWAMTGAAQAFAVSGHDVLRLAVEEGARLLSCAQHADGSYPYHPLDGNPGHPGASDVSAFYQSRVTAFLDFALEAAGLNRDAHADALDRGLGFLLGLQGPDGIKVGVVEAKPWYWGATHEVVSHPFDAAALIRGWTRTGEARYAVGALRAFRSWAAHVQVDGQPTSHAAGPGRRNSYQCPMFWAGHASWMARALPELERAMLEGATHPPKLIGGQVTAFEDAGVYRLEDATVVAWVRGARPAGNAHHGSPLGGGLIRAVAPDGTELLPRCRMGAHQAGEWTGKVGGVSLGRGWRSGGKELRFSLWMARNACRGGRILAGLGMPWRVFKEAVLAFAHPRVSTSFDRNPSVEVLDDGVRLEVRMAHRDGTADASGPIIARTFRIDGQGVKVDEAIGEGRPPKALNYRLPSRARDAGRGPERVTWRLGATGSGSGSAGG
jgi:hypothetical protein